MYDTHGSRLRAGENCAVYELIYVAGIIKNEGSIVLLVLKSGGEQEDMKERIFRFLS